MGYIYPLYYSFSILEDTDYSNSFIAKFNFENRQLKSEYAYFILINPENVIEDISLGAIHLGLSLDLLKKYIVKINNLIRNTSNLEININENYGEYEEEPKEIQWIFPDLIYPKDVVEQKKEEEIEELIKKSKKKKYNLLIKPIQFKPNTILGFLLKLTEIELKKGRKIINEGNYIPKADNNLVMFYLKKLSYVRTHVVKQKSGFRNLKGEEESLIKENTKSEVSKFYNNKRSVRTKISEDESSEENKTNINGLTKDKILELQVSNYMEIKDFISSLPLYGYDVSLERFRPNGDKYSASKIAESLIKIRVSEFCKRMDDVVGKS